MSAAENRITRLGRKLGRPSTSVSPAWTRKVCHLSRLEKQCPSSSVEMRVACHSREDLEGKNVSNILQDQKPV